MTWQDLAYVLSLQGKERMNTALPVIRTASFFTYKGPGRISIARYAPRGTPAGFRAFKALAPGDWFNKVTWDEYVPRYNAEILGRLEPKETLAKLQELAGEGNIPTLLCWEKPPIVPGNECHRRLVADWFQQRLGIDVPEFVPEVLTDVKKAGKLPPRMRREQVSFPGMKEGK